MTAAVPGDTAVRGCAAEHLGHMAQGPGVVPQVLHSAPEKVSGGQSGRYHQEPRSSGAVAKSSTPFRLSTKPSCAHTGLRGSPTGRYQSVGRR